MEALNSDPSALLSVDSESAKDSDMISAVQLKILQVVFLGVLGRRSDRQSNFDVEI